MGNELFQARIDDKFADRIHEYREDRHMSKSEAVRHLMREGLRANGEGLADTGGDDLDQDDSAETRPNHALLEQLASPNTVLGGTAIFVIGFLLIFPAVELLIAGSSTLATLAFGLSFALGFTGLGSILASILANVALARPLRALVLPWEVEA